MKKKSRVIKNLYFPSINDLDTDILANMTSLGSFKDKEKLIECLLNERYCLFSDKIFIFINFLVINLRHNTEKVIYFLLLERKVKSPCNEDDEDLSLRFRTGKSRIFFQLISFSLFVSKLVDAPRKRIDRVKIPCGLYSQLTVGSPMIGKRGLIIQ